MDSTASIVMAIALVFYTLGVWSEKIQGKLTIYHLLLFGLGLVCDSYGTGIMFRINEGNSFSFHGFVGIIAISLMFLHAIWAIVVLYKKDEKRIKTFHKYSLSVWVIWLIPYLSPIVKQIIS